MNETNHPARRLRHGDRPTEPLVFEDAAANKAAEEGGLPALPNPETKFTKLHGMTFSSTGYTNIHMEDYAHAAIAADRASRQVANKAEVEPTCVCGSPTTLGSVHRTDGPCYVAEATPPATTGASTAPRPTDDDLWDATIRDRDAYHEWADNLAYAIAVHFDVDIGEHSNQNLPWAEALEVIENAEPVGASTVLTDERIERDFLKHWDSVSHDYGFHREFDTAYKAARAAWFAREVAAQAGQVAVPEYAFPTFEHWLASDIETAPHGLTQQQKTIGYARLAFNAGRASPVKEST